MEDRGRFPGSSRLAIRRPSCSGRKEESVTIDQLIEHLQGEHDNKLQVHTGHRMRVGKVLQHLGWEKKT